MNILLILAVAVGAYFLLKNRLLRTKPPYFVDNAKFAIATPIIQITCFLPLYNWGTGVLEGAMQIDRLRDLSTYTPYLSRDLRNIVDFASRNDLLPTFEQSSEMQELLLIAGIIDTFSTVGLLLVIGLAIAELYGVFHLGKFTQKRMKIFFCIISIIFICTAILALMGFLKLGAILAPWGNNDNNLIYIIPVIMTIILMIIYVFFTRSLEMLYSFRK